MRLLEGVGGTIPRSMNEDPRMGSLPHGAVVAVPTLELTHHLLWARCFAHITHYLPHSETSPPRSILYMRRLSLQEVKGVHPAYQTG